MQKAARVWREGGGSFRKRKLGAITSGGGKGGWASADKRSDNRGGTGKNVSERWRKRGGQFHINYITGFVHYKGSCHAGRGYY